jgi:hypothetical protein
MHNFHTEAETTATLHSGEVGELRAEIGRLTGRIAELEERAASGELCRWARARGGGVGVGTLARAAPAAARREWRVRRWACMSASRA